MSVCLISQSQQRVRQLTSEEENDLPDYFCLFPNFTLFVFFLFYVMIFYSLVFKLFSLHLAFLFMSSSLYFSLPAGFFLSVCGDVRWVVVLRPVCSFLKLFKLPLEKEGQVGGPILAQEEMKTIFGSIPEIYDVHTRIKVCVLS